MLDNRSLTLTLPLAAFTLGASEAVLQEGTGMDAFPSVTGESSRD
jgi:hypothetical protein